MFVTLVVLIKIEAPGGDVNLTTGGFADFDAGAGVERYDAQHPIFGTIAEPGAIEEALADMAQDGSLTLAPNAAAAVSSWFRGDLADSRVRMWLGELGGDGKTVVSARQLSDMLVDTIDMTIGGGGQRMLELGLISRAEKLFLINEGNVCSQRFHQSVWPGEKGFNNCTDIVGFVAWGAESPPRSGGAAQSAPGGFWIGRQ